ncbi:MAG: hypothetical protein KF729_11220 [Sandaracinaceae bacterium]|nr:hypothetical protein [Sandaracinaceae bacterium]
MRPPVDLRPLLLAALGAALSWPALAGAQVDEDFRQAREAYANGELARVVRLLEPLVGQELATIGDRVMAREARKYLGAAYALTGAPERARDQFRWLLEDNRDQLRTLTLDRRVFIQEVRELFEAVQAELIAADERSQRDEQSRRDRQREERREALITLLHQAQEQTVEVPNDELPAFIPFGVGQFLNGDAELGWFFAVGEGVLALGAFSLLSSALLVDSELRQVGGRIVAGYDALLEGLTIANLVTAAVFVVLAVAGVVEARSSWRPTRTVRQRRDVDPQILERLDLEGLGQGAATLRF